MFMATLTSPPPDGIPILGSNESVTKKSYGEAVSAMGDHSQLDLKTIPITNVHLPIKKSSDKLGKTSYFLYSP